MREHKSKHSFQDTINPLCSCALDIESTGHFLLHCPQFVNERHTLLSTIGNIHYKLLENTDSVLTQTLLFGNTSFDITDNTKILNATINFILLTKRFDEPLFQTKSVWLIFFFFLSATKFIFFPLLFSCLDHNFFLFKIIRPFLFL